VETSSLNAPDATEGTSAIRSADGLTGPTAAVAALRGDLIACSTRSAQELTAVHAAHRQDAQNLLHYLELRGRDVRGLQESLADLGLSSLGRSEGHVLATVDAVLGHVMGLGTDGEADP
jgi:pyruvate kinase